MTAGSLGAHYTLSVIAWWQAPSATGSMREMLVSFAYHDNAAPKVQLQLIKGQAVIMRMISS